MQTMTTPERLKPEQSGKLMQRKRQALNLTQAQLAERVGIPDQPYVSSLEKGRIDLAESSYFPAIAQELQFTQAEVRSISPRIIVNLSEQATRPSQAHLTELEDHNLSPVYAIADAHRPLSYQTIPLENLQVWVAPNNRRPGLKLYAASGHSMDNGAQNAIKDGFILYVDTNERNARDGGLYVIHVHGDGNCVKRARVLGGQFWLFSDNVDQGKYPPFQPDEADIIGEVYLFQAPPQKP